MTLNQIKLTEISTLLCSAKALTRAEKMALQDGLRDLGYKNNAQTYGSDGKIGISSLRDIALLVHDHPEIGIKMNTSFKMAIERADLKFSSPSQHESTKDSSTNTAYPTTFSTSGTVNFNKAAGQPTKDLEPYNIRETKNGTVAYVNLPHSPGQSGRTALLIPNNFDPNKPAVMMPYFHGHRGGIEDSLNRQRLLETASASGKNIVFVVSELGARSDIKPQFKNTSYSNQFLSEASTALAATYAKSHPGIDQNKINSTFKNMPVSIVSYSGGYQATTCLLNDARVKGVILLDSMYRSASPFIQFSNRPDSPFVSTIYGPSTSRNVNDFSRNTNGEKVHITRMAGDHASLVQTSLAQPLSALSIEKEGRINYNPMNGILLAQNYNASAPAP